MPNFLFRYSFILSMINMLLSMKTIVTSMTSKVYNSISVIRRSTKKTVSYTRTSTKNGTNDTNYTLILNGGVLMIYL